MVEYLILHWMQTTQRHTTVRITSGDLFGWGEAGQYGPPEPVASAIQVRRWGKYFLSVNIFLIN